jgi:hypothetical protein
LSRPTHKLDLAPLPKTIDGLVAVLMDIQQLDSQIVFDMASKRAQTKSTVKFVSGIIEGNPIFDLRQNILKAVFNGEPILVDKLQHHDFDGGPNAELRILEKVVPPFTRHTLTLLYDLDQPQCPKSRPIGWNPPRLFFEFWFSDLWPARYLEMWFPSNLIFDEFQFTLDIKIINTSVKHVAFSNGLIDQSGENHWQINYPSTFNSFSPMLCVLASDVMEFRRGDLVRPDNGRHIRLNTFKLMETSENLTQVENSVRHHITDNITNIGPYIHGDIFTTFLWSNTGGRSMEYDGAVTTEPDALEHEVFHSWFARGIKPASQNDSWMDEGWTVFNTTDPSQMNPFEMSDPAVTLSSMNPFNRITPNSRFGPDAYRDGSRFFASLATELGTAEIRSHMVNFYLKNKGLGMTSKQLQSYLIDESGSRNVGEYFDRFVFGLS